MDQSELLRHVVSALERMNVPYFITGSVASTAYGESRFTNDIDIVADLSLTALPPFLHSFPAQDFYREGGSEKHLRDITGILKSANVPIDRAYIAQWAAT